MKRTLPTHSRTFIRWRRCAAAQRRGGSGYHKRIYYASEFYFKRYYEFGLLYGAESEPRRADGDLRPAACGYDTGYEKVSPAPMIVAGQGEDGANYTLIRVFNSSQACISQFLAFPPEVKGGVLVKAGHASSGQALIAAAAYDASKNAAKTIKVFDTAGSLRYSFTPQGVEAPFTIEIGKFLPGSDKDYLFVASKLSGGDGSKYELYDLDDGSFVKSIDGAFDNSIAAQRITLSASSEEGDDVQKLIITFKESKAVYYLDCGDSSWTKSEIRLPDNATGVYASAFSGELVASLDGDTFSNVRIYGSGASDNLEGSLLNVGYKENRFYSTYAEDNPEGYVDYAAFNHIRTDLANGVINSLNELATEETEALWNIWKMRYMRTGNTS